MARTSMPKFGCPSAGRRRWALDTPFLARGTAARGSSRRSAFATHAAGPWGPAGTCVGPSRPRAPRPETAEPRTSLVTGRGPTPDNTGVRRFLKGTRKPAPIRPGRTTPAWTPRHTLRCAPCAFNSEVRVGTRSCARSTTRYRSTCSTTRDTTPPATTFAADPRLLLERHLGLEHQVGQDPPRSASTSPWAAIQRSDAVADQRHVARVLMRHTRFRGMAGAG